MLYRSEYYEDAPVPGDEVTPINEAELIIAKNRHGPTNTVKVAWNGDFTMFTNLETLHNDL